MVGTPDDLVPKKKVTITIPLDVYDGLREDAAKRNRSVTNWIGTVVIERYAQDHQDFRFVPPT